VELSFVNWFLSQLHGAGLARDIIVYSLLSDASARQVWPVETCREISLVQ
jgi:hypothetical protein